MSKLTNTSSVFRKTLAVAGLTLALTGCGKQAFVVTSTTSAQQAPGSYYLQPKVDILLAEDDTGSMYEAYDPIAKQLPEFLKKLEERGWDYHFATTPLTNKSRAISEILASKHDSNWGPEWTPPFPGAQPGLPGTIAANLFRRLNQYTQFITTADISNSQNGMEPGLESIRDALQSRLNNTGFLRSDALLVVLAIGNGEDTSGVTYCRRAVDGYMAPCEDLGQAGGTKESSFQNFKTQFQSVKTHPDLVRFYAAVAKTRTNDCLGGASLVGTRYMKMATALGGESYDICTQSVNSVLDSMSQRLQSQKRSYRTRYLMLDQAPEVDTIQVVAYIGGDPNQKVELPQDPDNGWTYAGYLTNIHTVDAPIPMNRTSGYAIELHGSAKLLGDDRADVTFKPEGARNSVSK